MSITAAPKFIVMALILCTALLAACQQEVAPPPAAIAPDSRQEYPIAVQMFTLRHMPSLEDQLKAVQAAGIAAIEIGGTQGVRAEELKQLLEAYSLKVTSGHLAGSLADVRRDLDTLVSFHQTIGNTIVIAPGVSPGSLPTDAAGWMAAGEELGELAARFAQAGMTLAYHNHDFELVDFDGKTGLELLFEAAGPQLQAQIDVAWVARAGVDPAAFLGKFQGRVFAIHAKDNAPEGENTDEGGFAAVGSGVLDWDAILPAAATAGVKWYIIEHDHPRDPAASIKASADYLKAHLPIAR